MYLCKYATNIANIFYCPHRGSSEPEIPISRQTAFNSWRSRCPNDVERDKHGVGICYSEQPLEVKNESTAKTNELDVIRAYIESYVRVYELDPESKEAVGISKHFMSVIDELAVGSFDNKGFDYTPLTIKKREVAK